MIVHIGEYKYVGLPINVIKSEKHGGTCLLPDGYINIYMRRYIPDVELSSEFTDRKIFKTNGMSRAAIDNWLMNKAYAWHEGREYDWPYEEYDEIEFSERDDLKLYMTDAEVEELLKNMVKNVA